VSKKRKKFHKRLQESKERKKFQRNGLYNSLLTGKFWLKIQTQSPEVIKNNKDHQISIFGFQCLAKKK